jgi:hypothetical protein
VGSGVTSVCGVIPELPAGSEFGSEFFLNFRSTRQWLGRFMLRSRYGTRKFADFDQGRRREIFLPRQGTFLRWQAIHPSGRERFC